MLTDAEVVVGGRHGTIRVPDATVSRCHARIFREGDGVWVESINGGHVAVNGVRRERAQLFNRDRIQTGALELEFWLG